ncbi:unnamed protein product, partial [Effrenium voratum]
GVAGMLSVLQGNSGAEGTCRGLQCAVPGHRIEPQRRLAGAFECHRPSVERRGPATPSGAGTPRLPRSIHGGTAPEPLPGDRANLGGKRQGCGPRRASGRSFC